MPHSDAYEVPRKFSANAVEHAAAGLKTVVSGPRFTRVGIDTEDCWLCT